MDGSLWRIGNYRNWFVSDTAEALAKSMRAFAVPLIAFEISRSESVAGVLTAIESTLVMALTPIGGGLVDMLDRKKMMRLLGFAGFALSLATALMLWLGPDIAALCVLIVLFGVVTGLLGGSNDAILKSLIPETLFPGAQAVRESREAALDLSGGLVSGLLYSLSSAAIFVASSLSYLTSAVAASSIRTPSPHRPDDASDRNGPRANPLPAFARHLHEGWRWCSRRPTFLAAMLVGAFVNVSFVMLVTGSQIMLAASGTSSVLIGLISTGMGVSALIGSLLAIRLVNRVRTGLLIVLCLAFITACFVPLLFRGSFPCILAMTSLVGLPVPALNAALYGFLFGKTPEDMQGRASAVFETSVGLASAVTPAFVGPMLQLDNGFTLVIASAVVFSALGVLTALCSRIKDIPRITMWDMVTL